MENATGDIIKRLEKAYPGWMCWVVHRVIGGPVWCGKRWDGTGQAVNADSPEHLSEYIREAEHQD
jgi:hypothetical protein